MIELYAIPFVILGLCTVTALIITRMITRTLGL